MPQGPVLSAGAWVVAAVVGAVPVIAWAPLLTLRPRGVPDSDQVPVPIPGVIAAVVSQIARVEATAAHVTGVKATVSSVSPRIESGAKVPGDGGVLREVVVTVAGGAGEAALVAE